MQLLRPSACGTALGLEFRVQRFQDVDFFKAKLIQSFDLNPTHPGPASKRQLPLGRRNSTNLAQEKERPPAAATDRAADKPRSRASGEQEEAASWPERGFTEKVREETAQAKRIRSNSYGLPASSLLLLAWRLKKTALRRGKRFNRASASEPCFCPEVENHGRGTKIDAPQPTRGLARFKKPRC